MLESTVEKSHYPSLFGPNVHFLNWFGVLPNIDRQTNKLQRVKLHLVHVIVLLLLMVGMEIYIWTQKFYMAYSTESYLPVIVRIACELAGFCMFVSVITWSYTKGKLWEKLFQELTTVYSQQIVREPRERKRAVLRNANFYFVLITFLILVLYCLDIFFWQLDNRSTNFILSYVYFYYSFLLSNLIGQIALEISVQYKYMKNALAAGEYTSVESFGNILIQTKRLHVQMYGVIDTFNKLFGRILLLMAIQCSLQVLDFGVFLVERVLPNLRFEYDAFFVYVIFIILDLIWFSVTQFRCDLARDESMKLLSVCYGLLDALQPDELQREICGLIKQIKNRPVRFTAAEFFEIKRSTTFSILGSTATYFIVYVELRSNDNSWTQTNNTA